MIMIYQSYSLLTITNISKLFIHGEHILASEQTRQESHETFLRVVQFPCPLSQLSVSVILILMLLLRLDDTVLFNFPEHDKLETMDFGSSIVFISMTEAKMVPISILPLIKIRWIISFRLRFCVSSFHLPYPTKPIQIHPKRTVKITVQNDVDDFDPFEAFDLLMMLHLPDTKKVAFETNS